MSDPSFDISALAGEFQAQSGGLTLDLCVNIIESIIADPNFTGTNDDDVRRILGIGNTAVVEQLEAQNAFLAKGLYDVIKIIAQYPSSQAAPFADLIQDAKTNLNAINPTVFTF